RKRSRSRVGNAVLGYDEVPFGIPSPPADPWRFRMHQRQLRLGDILDDYCPRERRVTNHAVVAMVGPDVKQTRCTTCDTEHEYKQARVPRQRRKAEAPAVLAQGVAGGPKRVVHDPVPDARVEGLNTSPNGLENPVEEL